MWSFRRQTGQLSSSERSRLDTWGMWPVCWHHLLRGWTLQMALLQSLWHARQLAALRERCAGQRPWVVENA